MLKPQGLLHPFSPLFVFMGNLFGEFYPSHPSRIKKPLSQYHKGRFGGWVKKKITYPAPIPHPSTGTH